MARCTRSGSLPFRVVHPRWMSADHSIPREGLEQRRNRLISRSGNIMTRFDELAEQVAGLLDLDDAILDGEVIANRQDRQTASL